MQKFNALTEGHTTGALRHRIIATVDNLERIHVRQLTELLQQAATPSLRPQEVLRRGAGRR
jgi:hypothetical protein